MDTVLQSSENVFSVPSENDRKADEKLYELTRNFKNEKEKNQKLEAEVKKLASDLKTERQIYLAEKKILEERAENVANNSKNVETHQEEFETLKKELEEGRKFEAQLMKETDRLVIQVEKLKRENLAKQNPHKNESGGTRELEQDIKILTLERTDLLGRIEALKSELTTVKKEKETLELQIRDNVADKTTVYGNTELENLRTAISELEKTRTDQAQIIEQNKTEKIQLEYSKAELMQKLESEKMQFLSEKKLLQDELSEMQKNLQQVQEEKNQLSSNFLKLEIKFQAELDAWNMDANANLEKMKLSQQAEVNALKEQHDSDKVLFETQMTEQKAVVKYFKDELDKAVRSSDELRKEKHRLTMENEDLKRGNSTQNFNIGNVQIKKEPNWGDGCQSDEVNMLATHREREQAVVNAVEQQHDHAEASVEKGMEENSSGVTATQPETQQAEERTNSRTGPDSQPLVDAQRSLELPSHDTGAGYESIPTKGGPDMLISQAANDETDDAASATEKNHDIDANHVSFPTISDPDVLSSQAADDANENAARVTKKGKRAKKQPTARTKRVAKQANLPPDENENEDVPSPKKNRRKTKKPPKSEAVVTTTAETDEEDSGASKTLKGPENPTAQSPPSTEQNVAPENAKKGTKSRKRGAKTDGLTTGQDEAPSPEKKTRTKRKTKNNDEEMASEDNKELALQIKTPQNKRGAKKTVNKIQDDASVTSTKKKPQPKRATKKKVQFDALEEDIESEPTPTPSTSQQVKKGAEKMVNEPEEMSDSGESPPSTKTNPRKKRGVKNEVEDKSDEPKEKPPARKKNTRRKNSEDQDDAPPIEEVESTKTKSTRNKKKNKAAEIAKEINVVEDLEAAPEARESADLGSPKKGGGDTAKKPRKPRAKKQTKKEEGPSDSSLPTLWETTEETVNKTSPVKRNRRKRN